MGASNSRIEDDKALRLCRERKQLVRQALDGRCSLAAAHISYIQSLRNTGTALKKFVEPEAPVESSLYTSRSATPEPPTYIDKSASHFSNSSATLSQNVETVESFSSIPSPLSSTRFHVNHMKAGRSFSTTIKEKPSTPVIVTLQTEATTPKGTGSHTDEDSTAETPPPPGTPPWDYFELFNPIDNQFSFPDGTALNHGLDNADHIRRLREEEGIPELEEEGETVSANEQNDTVDSEDDFDQASSEPLVQIYKNRNEDLDHTSIRKSPSSLSAENFALQIEQRNAEKFMEGNSMHETLGTAALTSPTASSSAAVLPINGHDKQHGSSDTLAAKDFMACMKEIENLFVKASESGKEVPRMLEANKVNFRPLFTNDKAYRSKTSSFLTSCLGCCYKEVHLPEDPAPNDVKYLTWHRSSSSLSSSSRNLIGVTTKDDVDDMNNNIFSSICMNSGSHASTLDRLYAWERKLYDEVKASGIIRRKYDLKCKLLRQQESRGESHYKIYKTRATVKDLYARIIVAIERIDSISKKIEELRDKELQPQLEELIAGLIQMWTMMLECHKQQYSIISSASNSPQISIRSESHRQSVILLEFELNSLCSSYDKWIDAHKSYLESINGWLLKCVFPRRQKSSRRKRPVEFSPRRDRAPPIFVACRDWLTLLKELPTSEVQYAIKDLVAVTTHFLPHQEKARGNVNINFAFSQKSGKAKELGEDRHSNAASASIDLNLNLDSFKLSLVVLLDRLKAYAESSVQKYVALQTSINDACHDYERTR